MATINADFIQQHSGRFNENLLPNFLTFNMDVDFGGWNTVTGEGVGVNDPVAKFKGGDSGRGLSLTTTDNTTDMEVNSGGIQTRFTATRTGNYTFQFWVKNPTGGVVDGDIMRIKFALNGVGGTTVINVPTVELLHLFDTFIGFSYNFNLNSGNTLDFSFVLPANDSATSSHTVYVDGLMLEYVDRLTGGVPSIYTEPPVQLPPVPSTPGKYVIDNSSGINTWVKGNITGSGTLNFGSISDGAFADLTFPLTGVGSGARLIWGAPASIYATGVEVFAFASNTDEITIRIRNNTGIIVDLPSAVYSVQMVF